MSATGSDARALARTYGTPLYVYDEDVLLARCRAIRDAIPLPGVEVLYALKANSNPEILRIIQREGLGADAVSLGEVVLAKRCGFSPARISFNGNNIDESELRALMTEGVHLCVDGLSQLERLGRLGHRAAVAIRLNPDIGAGHHGHVITGGPEAKFGIAPDELPQAFEIARKSGLVIDGIQQHIGSGILDVDVFLMAVDALLEAAATIPGLRYVDFGGGIGVPSKPGELAFDVPDLSKRIAPRLARFRERIGREVIYRIEPGRYVVAESGSLLVKVTAIKRTRDHVFVGTDSGFNHLVRPILYGAFHPIENVTNPDGRPEIVRVAGNICESGDLFAIDRPLPEPREDDLLLIRNVGAYGYSMASSYNLRPRPAEVMISSAGHRLIRRRETFEDFWSTFVDRA
jgi:diaminopimelate decarboxylase